MSHFGAGGGQTAAQKIGQFLEAKAKKERDVAKKAEQQEDATASRYELMPIPFDFSSAHKAGPRPRDPPPPLPSLLGLSLQSPHGASPTAATPRPLPRCVTLTPNPARRK